MDHKEYDVLIIGSGFGGSLAAYALAKAGLNTLLIERGGWPGRDEADWDAKEILVHYHYRSGSPLLIKQYRNRQFRTMPSNEVVGGNSVFYGGASLRLRERDFDAWPIDYADLEPYYTRAERLLEIHGQAGADPLEPPRSGPFPWPSMPLTSPARRVYRAAEAVGCRPFALPLAINFHNPDRSMCILCNTCDGFPCKIRAKNDLAETILRPALHLGLELMTGVVATRLVEEDGRIAAVACLDQATGEEFSLSANVVIISGGAIQSPALLLRSNLRRYDHHRFIGRNLMRHCNAVVCSFFPRKTNPEAIFHKQICITDFYEDLRSELNTSTGVIQDMYTPPRSALESFVPWGARGMVGATSEHLQNLVCVAEDTPNAANRVSLARRTDRLGLPAVKVEHHYCPDDYRRRRYLTRRAKKILHRAGGLADYVHPIDTFSHAVGTVRFGHSPESSVLDRFCRFFGLDNLFVVDGSFMPTSGGVNPSLTIAANSLRVADHIASSYVRAERTAFDADGAGQHIMRPECRRAR